MIITNEIDYNDIKKYLIKYINNLHEEKRINEIVDIINYSIRFTEDLNEIIRILQKEIKESQSE